MSYDYAIYVKIRVGTKWSASVLTKEILVTANLPELGILLGVLDASPAIEEITVSRVITVPTPIKMRRLTRKDLLVDGIELKKIL